MIVFVPGDIYAITCSYLSPKHEKYSICINQELARFLWINSKPRITRPKAQLKVLKGELPFLKYDSYIDTGQLYTFPPDDLNTARYLGSTPNDLRERIVAKVQSHGYLTPDQKKLILGALKT